jgi:hypothetical protein
MPDSRSYSTVVGECFQGLKTSQRQKNVERLLRNQIIYKIVSMPKRIGTCCELSSSLKSKVNTLHDYSSAKEIQKLFYAQDLHLDSYRRLFYYYHHDTHHFLPWKPFLTQKIFQKISKGEINKQVSTYQMRKCRIEQMHS